MNAVEQIEALKLAVGAKPGQILLLVDLTSTPNPTEVLAGLKEMSYEPQIRYCLFATGLHVMAVLKNEQLDPTLDIDDEYLMDEWISLGERFGQESVRLWRGHPSRKTMAIAA